MTKIYLELIKISKTFKNKKIFQNLSFKFHSGNFVIKGQNGIGKSTLLSIIVGAISHDSGNIIVNDIDAEKDPIFAKRCISYIPDKTMIYPFITGKEFINFICYIKKSSIDFNIERLIDKFNINSYMDISFNKMSLGTQKKFMIIGGLIGNADILVMDEPTNGLDKKSYQDFVEYLLKCKNKILIFSTHDSELIRILNAKEVILKKNEQFSEFEN